MKKLFLIGVMLLVQGVSLASDSDVDNTYIVKLLSNRLGMLGQLKDLHKQYPECPRENSLVRADYLENKRSLERNEVALLYNAKHDLLSQIFGKKYHTDQTIINADHVVNVAETLKYLLPEEVRSELDDVIISIRGWKEQQGKNFILGESFFLKSKPAITWQDFPDDIKDAIIDKFKFDLELVFKAKQLNKEIGTLIEKKFYPPLVPWLEIANSEDEQLKRLDEKDNLTHTESLVFRNITTENNSKKPINKFLKNSNVLNEVYFANSTIDPDFAEDVLLKLNKERTTRLGFIGTPLSSEVLPYLKLSINKLKALTSLILSNCNIDHKMIRENIVDGIKNNKTLQYLNLSCNTLLDAGLDEILDAIEQSSIISLDLTSAGLTTNGAPSRVNRFLQGNKSQLRKLILAENCFSWGIGDIVRALQNNTHLQILDLSGCSKQGYVQDNFSLFDPLIKNQTLRVIKLSNNCLNNSTAFGIAKVLRNNSILEEIDLSANVISDEGSEYIALSLKYNKALKILNLSYNQITDDGVKELDRFHKEYNKTLKKIIIEGNPIEIPQTFPLPNNRQRFLNGKLVYKPNKDNDIGKIELRIGDLTNPLESAFNLSMCGDVENYLSISTGYRKKKISENSDRLEIWLTPRFFVENISERPRHLEKLFPDKWPETAPVGIFWAWGEWNDMGWYDYLTKQTMEELGNNDLYNKMLESDGYGAKEFPKSRPGLRNSLEKITVML